MAEGRASRTTWDLAPNSKIGNSQGLIFDAALRELTGLRAGDQVTARLRKPLRRRTRAR